MEPLLEKKAQMQDTHGGTCLLSQNSGQFELYPGPVSKQNTTQNTDSTKDLQMPQPGIKTIQDRVPLNPEAISQLPSRCFHTPASLCAFALTIASSCFHVLRESSSPFLVTNSLLQALRLSHT